MYHYVIDWDKVQTLDDIKRLIAAIQISFEPNGPNIEGIKDLVRLEKKQPPMATTNSEGGGYVGDEAEAAKMLIYFWQTKGDIERWAGFDRERLAREFPAVLKAWDNHTASLAGMDTVVRDLERIAGS